MLGGVPPNLNKSRKHVPTSFDHSKRKNDPPLSGIDADFDFDFTKHSELPKDDKKKNSPSIKERKSVPNPLVAETSSQWVAPERLEDWVKLISDINPQHVDSQLGKEENEDELNSENTDSGESSDDSGTDETSLPSDEENSQSSESSNFRTKFLEDEDKICSSSESLEGSRLSKSQPPVT